MGGIRATSVLLLFGVSLAMYATGQAADLPQHYVAVGASETLGFGVSQRASYPQIVSRECGMQVSVFADVGVPAVLQHVHAPNRPFVLSLFIGANDIRELSIPDFRRDLDRQIAAIKRASLAVIFFAPDLTDLPSFYGDAPLREKQHRLESEAKRLLMPVSNVKIVKLKITGSARDSLLLADGLHPSEQGQEEIAALVRSRLGDYCLGH